MHMKKIRNQDNLPIIQNDGNKFHDFSDTYAAIAACDEILTVDTAVAHLAGYMGHPTTIVISNPPDWRWGLQTLKSALYRNSKIIRHANQSKN